MKNYSKFLKVLTPVSILSLFIAMGVLFTSCPSKEDDSELDAEYLIVEEKIIQAQQESYELFEQLILSMDTADVLNEMQDLILQDTMVEDCYITRQALWIEYKMGYLGGLFFNPLYRGDHEVESQKAELGIKSFGEREIVEMTDVQVKSSSYVVPGSKKAILICSSYDNSKEGRKSEVDLMISNYNDRLPAVKFNKPVLIKNDDVTVDLFTNLTGYGLIHFTCHGVAWPDEDNIKKVYMQTGESFNRNTFKKYFHDLQSNKIAILTSDMGARFYVTGDFVGENNDFLNDTTLFYSGMCYSWLGEWPEALVHRAHAGGYLGFDWSVYKNKEVSYNFNLIIDLCDIYQSKPITVDKWMTNEVTKWYWDDFDSKPVNIKYVSNYPDLCLWRTQNDVYVDPEDKLYCVWYADNIALNPVMVGTKADFKKKKLCSSYPGGGNDPDLVMDKVMMTEGHDTRDEAIEAACALFDEVNPLPGSSTFVWTTYLGWIGDERYDCDELGGCRN